MSIPVEDKGGLNVEDVTGSKVEDTGLKVETWTGSRTERVGAEMVGLKEDSTPKVFWDEGEEDTGGGVLGVKAVVMTGSSRGTGSGRPLAGNLMRAQV